MNYEYLKPKYRSGIRSYFWKKYYTYKRYIQWWWGPEKYSKNFKNQ